MLVTTPTCRSLSVPIKQYSQDNTSSFDDAQFFQQNSSRDKVLYAQVSFCLMKKDRRFESCQVHVMPRTVSWMRIQRITRPLVDSD